MEAAIHGPYEDVAIMMLTIIGKAMDGQPPEVRTELWKLFLEDVKAWRAFWSGLKIG